MLLFRKKYINHLPQQGLCDHVCVWREELVAGGQKKEEGHLFSILSFVTMNQSYFELISNEGAEGEAPHTKVLGNTFQLR